MTEEKDPLHTWNNLNISIAERDMVKALFSGALSTSETLDRFFSWLLAGVAGTAALFITNVGSILPYISETGFRRCGALLVIAGLFGLLSKQRALKVKLHIEQERIISQAMTPVFDKHEESEEEIKKQAMARGINIDTDIDFNRVIETFVSSFPKFMRSSLNRSFKAGFNDSHSGQRTALRHLLYQGAFGGVQTFFFIGFILVAVFYSSAI